MSLEEEAADTRHGRTRTGKHLKRLVSHSFCPQTPRKPKLKYPPTTRNSQCDSLMGLWRASASNPKSGSRIEQSLAQQLPDPLFHGCSCPNPFVFPICEEHAKRRIAIYVLNAGRYLDNYSKSVAIEVPLSRLRLVCRYTNR